jgi:hypothetical protein
VKSLHNGPARPGHDLKVTKILHVEKLLYQDVLVFESETHGNVLVLVLDGVTQCTERNEFLYAVCVPYLFILTSMSQAAVDIIVSLILYTLHVTVIEAAIKGNMHVVTTSYVSPAVWALEEWVKAAGIVVMNEIGLDPGIDYLYAVKTIYEVHAQRGKVLSSLPARVNPAK